MEEPLLGSERKPKNDQAVISADKVRLSQEYMVRVICVLVLKVLLLL